jgi:hypothetical protein
MEKLVDDGTDLEGAVRLEADSEDVYTDSYDKVTYDIMGSHSPAPHSGVPLAHARDDGLLKILDKHGMEHRARSVEDV